MTIKSSKQNGNFFEFPANFWENDLQKFGEQLLKESK